LLGEKEAILAEQADCLPGGVARGSVAPREFPFGGDLLAGDQVAALDGGS
jgi:hypothetical protein